MEGARYLEDGKLTIFKRAGIFYARIRISPGKYFWRSLKTTDEQTAIHVGRKLFYSLEERVEHRAYVGTQTRDNQRHADEQPGDDPKGSVHESFI